jgi:hypothetical protein
MRIAEWASLLVVVSLAGCTKERGATPAETAPAGDAGQATASGADDVTMRYRCGRNSVDVLGGAGARVRLADGRVVLLPRVAGSSPPAFAGEALSFAIGSRGGELSQDEGARWECSAA